MLQIIIYIYGFPCECVGWCELTHERRLPCVLCNNLKVVYTCTVCLQNGCHHDGRIGY